MQHQFRQRGCRALAMGAVAAAQFIQQVLTGGIVGGAVVHGEQQQGLGVAAALQQGGADRHLAGEVETASGFCVDGVVGQLLPVRVAGRFQGCRLQGDVDLRFDDQRQLAVALAHDAAAQDFVTLDHVVQGRLQGPGVELTVQLHGADHVVFATSGAQLFQEPQALLFKRQRQARRAWRRNECRCGRLQRGAQQRGQGLQGRVFEHGPQRRHCGELLAQTGKQHRSQQRMTAEVEEMAVATDLRRRHFQQLRPQHGDLSFGAAAWRIQGVRRSLLFKQLGEGQVRGYRHLGAVPLHRRTLPLRVHQQRQGGHWALRIGEHLLEQVLQAGQGLAGAVGDEQVQGKHQLQLDRCMGRAQHVQIQVAF
ncbi:hypothetical protein ALQ77_01728 [Pseudomonas corrugata]|uniref:Uncharacterized protein n=1 Tax=Pseudomonas corrugata TaxID=47879 RepID=A0A3M3E1C1_9PSED|nr:hypothetical protein ALQ77_01728 [Pseudomonas corrugata]